MKIILRKTSIIFLLLNLIFGIHNSTFSQTVIDTLRNHDPSTSSSTSSLNTVTFPSQYASFQPPAPGYIKSIIITLGGSADTGSVTVHIYGSEGGSSTPMIEKDLTTPIIVNKTLGGNQKITVNLTQPILIENNSFFIKVTDFSPNVTLIKDQTVHDPFCASSSGGNYSMQWGKTSGGTFLSFNKAYVIDVVMEYTEGLTSPQHLQDITAAVGIDTNLSNRSIAWGDINNDGKLDLLVYGKLYKNNGNSSFTDITTSAGITTSGISTFMDMDNDGNDDILFLKGGGASSIYINNGDETFTQYALNFTTPNFVSISSYSIGDFNNDSYPDLFVGQLWKNDSVGNEEYYPHYLYLNDKNLGFIDTSSLITPAFLNWETLSGTANPSPYLVGTTRTVRGAQWVDYNDDGMLDLYIANYRLQPDELWKNNGDGTFTDVCQALGIDTITITAFDYSGHGTGCDWADYDNDGNMDLLLPQLAHPWLLEYDMRPTSIYKNNGAPTYDFTNMNPGVNMGLGIEYEETHAGASWGDINNDGLLDFAISVFYGCRFADVYLQKLDHTFEMKSFAFGLKDVTAAQDLVFTDFDNDGKLDLSYGVNTGSGDRFRLFKNKGPFYGNYVELDLVSTSGNKKAVGAKTVVYAGGKEYTQYQMPYHGAFMSKGNRIHVGLGSASVIDSVVVRWPNGTTNTEKFTGLTVNKYNVLTEGGTVAVGIERETELLLNLSVYPNPASTEVVFKYELTKNETVSLDIYSMLGEKTTILKNNNQVAGQHVVQWNIKDNLASGIYSYRLQVGELQKTGLLVLSR